MGVPRESLEVVCRILVAEIIEQEEGIGLVRVAEAEGAAEADTGSLQRGLRLDDAFDGADRHEANWRD
jgi:hypothetical protein